MKNKLLTTLKVIGVIAFFSAIIAIDIAYYYIHYLIIIGAWKLVMR